MNKHPLKENYDRYFKIDETILTDKYDTFKFDSGDRYYTSKGRIIGAIIDGKFYPLNVFRNTGVDLHGIKDQELHNLLIQEI